MRAMVFHQSGQPLLLEEQPLPQPGEDQILLRVHACGVCRTDLHIVDGELTSPKLPLIPGHEIVGSVVQCGSKVIGVQRGDLMGVPWLGYTCGTCRFCQKGLENLCENGGYTGYTIDGGYAEYTVADQRYCFPIASHVKADSTAPLLCAGLIGYRSYRMIDASAEDIGIYGFGAAAHIITQVAVHQGKKIYAFTRSGDMDSQQLARQLGAVWCGDSITLPPVKLDAAIIFAPVGSLLPAALAATDAGGMVVCGGIHMSDIPSFPYSLLWQERTVKSVANLTRQDGVEFLKIAAQIPVRTTIQTYALEQANEALDHLRAGQVRGAAVLVMDRN
jgi:alcohol dehydrogenase, propanol-preferring